MYQDHCTVLSDNQAGSFAQDLFHRFDEDANTRATLKSFYVRLRLGEEGVDCMS